MILVLILGIAVVYVGYPYYRAARFVSALSTHDLDTVKKMVGIGWEVRHTGPGHLAHYRFEERETAGYWFSYYDEEVSKAKVAPASVRQLLRGYRTVRSPIQPGNRSSISFIVRFWKVEVAR